MKRIANLFTNGPAQRKRVPGRLTDEPSGPSESDSWGLPSELDATELGNTVLELDATELGNTVSELDSTELGKTTVKTTEPSELGSAEPQGGLNASPVDLSQYPLECPTSFELDSAPEPKVSARNVDSRTHTFPYAGYINRRHGRLQADDWMQAENDAEARGQ